MIPHSRRSIVVLGMMTKMPVPGVIWQTLHYLIGFRRLGYDVVYVEAHARAPAPFMETPTDPGTARAAAFLHDLSLATISGIAGRTTRSTKVVSVLEWHSASFVAPTIPRARS